MGQIRGKADLICPSDLSGLEPSCPGEHHCISLAQGCPTGQDLPGIPPSSMWEEFLGGERVLKMMENQFSVENYEKEAWKVGCHKENIVWVL